MLDINLIRNEPERVKAALLKRMDSIDFSDLLQADRQVRDLIGDIDELRSERKKIAQAVEEAFREGRPNTNLQNQAIELKSHLSTLEKQLSEARERFDSMMAELPNLPDERVPPGGKESNVCLRTWGKKPDIGKSTLDHVELSIKHGLVDYERGVKLAGSGFWLYVGRGAALEWSLLNYFCHKHYSDGYQFVLPPHLLTPASGFAAGQFPKFYDDVFHLQTRSGDQERFLLPTAETALLNIYRDEILPEEKLPIKLFAYTPCYRREGGGNRADEHGTVRGHQFNKVEMFQFVKPEQAEAALEELLSRAEQILQELGLHYRTVLLAAKDASASMVLTYDLEVWLPSISDYKEVTSVSWAADYQARRAKIRYRPSKKKNTQFVHTLNASGLATSRLLPAILEQHQQVDGSVLLPEPLRKWLGMNRIGAVSS